MTSIPPKDNIKAYYQRKVNLNQAELAFLEQAVTHKFIPKGDFLLKAGQPCNFVAYIDSGLCRMYYSIIDKEYVVAFMKEDCYISDYESFLLRKPATCSIQTLEDSHFFLLDYTTVQKAYQISHQFERFGRLISEHLFLMLSNRNTNLLTLSPDEHYQLFINTNPDLVQRVPQYMIASYLGITPEALSRIRKRIAD